MHYWETIITRFNRNQLFIGSVEQMTREELEAQDDTWTTQDDVPPEQKAHEDAKPTKEIEEKPF